MSTCKSCGAEIKWIKLKSGKFNPVDPCKRLIIKDEGTEAVLVTDDGEVITGTYADYEHGANASGYVSHFATCPQAQSFRKR